MNFWVKNFSLIKNHIENSEILLLAILLVDLKGNHEYFSHKYKVSNKVHENLYLLGNKFRDSKFDKEFFFEMEVGFSENLSLFQLNDHPKPESMFNEKYPFFTGSSEYMKKHFKNF